MREPKINKNETSRSWTIPIIVIASVCSLIYLQTVGFHFIQWDDPRHIFENKRILNPSIEGLFSFWSSSFFSLYIPVMYSVWMAVANVSVDPSAYHLLSWILHVANTLLVYFLFRSWLDRGKKLVHHSDPVPRISHVTHAIPALFGALLFATHPLQVEAVAWISASKDLLSTLLSLLALLNFSTRSRLAFLCFILATLTKPSAVILPLIVVLTQVLTQVDLSSTRIIQALKRTAHWFGVSALVLVITKLQQPDSAVEFVTPWFFRPLLALDSLGFYFTKILYPVDLVIDYGRNPQSLVSSSGLKAWAYGFVIPLILGLLLLCKRFKEILPYEQMKLGISWFAVSVLPVLGFLAFRYQVYSNVADRYAYFGMVGIAWVSASILSQAQYLRNLQRPLARTYRSVSLIVGAVVISTLSVLSFRQVKLWKDSEGIFLKTLEVNPLSYMSHNNLATHYHFTKNYPKAAQHFGETVALRPGKAELYSNWGASLVALGEHIEGIEKMRIAVDLDPRSATSHYNLAKALMMAGNPMEAEQHLRQARELLNRPIHSD